jgi:hypothetical protein
LPPPFKPWFEPRVPADLPPGAWGVGRAVGAGFGTAGWPPCVEPEGLGLGPFTCGWTEVACTAAEPSKSNAMTSARPELSIFIAKRFMMEPLVGTKTVAWYGEVLMVPNPGGFPLPDEEYAPY